jgi:hypothetical protein
LKYDSWRWIFLASIPLCLLATWLIIRNFEKKVQQRFDRNDVAGTITLTLGASAS